MTSSRTGQSPNVELTHSLWRMSPPPRQITAALLVDNAAYLGAIRLVFGRDRSELGTPRRAGEIECSRFHEDLSTASATVFG